MNKPFAHLHLHTEYSLLDGTAKIDKLFSACERLNIKAVAITDHGNMYGVCKFDAAAIYHTLKRKIEAEDWARMGEQYKIKPIFGCEFYFCEDINVRDSINGRAPKLFHLVLLAKDYEGYLNLCKLNAQSYIKGYYYKPRIDRRLLEQYSKGLVCLSACLAGSIPQCILQENNKKAREWAEYYKSIFGSDFYIELQNHGLTEQRLILPHLVNIARELDIKTVVTNDVHYIEQDDADMQKVLQCVNFKRKLSEMNANEGEDYFPVKEFYLKSYEEMQMAFPHHLDALDNTLEIADKCNCILKYKQSLLPNFYPPDSSTPYEYLRKLTFDGINRKYKVVTDEIIKRAEYELETINKTGFVEYFLIVWDFINYAESKGIAVGPGRGSGVGSIVAYATGITKVEPLKYNLLFERFLNLERVSMPDFDIDFCFERRDEVIDYVIGKYGEDKVSQITTFGTLAIKAAIKDVGRVMEVPYSETDKMSKAVGRPDKKARLVDLVGKGDDRFIVNELKDIYDNDPTAKRVIDFAAKVEGLPRQTGMHAAGVVICKEPISDNIPLSMAKDVVTTQYDMIECEKIGLLKMDFLGLKTLTDVSKSIQYIRENTGQIIDFYNMEYDDPNVYELISRGDTHAVFQLESEGMKDFMRKLKPQSLEDIIAGVALYRPGPMDSIPEYIQNKNNPKNIHYDHPLLEPILKVTYGVLIYQEQVMDIVRALAGFSLGGADILRRAMSKKKADAMLANKTIFIHGGEQNGKKIDGAVKRGVSEEVAASVFEKIEKFASYAFNKSHAAAYAYLAYQTAYLKCYHKREFLTAVLNNRITNSDEIKNYLTYARDYGINILPPNVNLSRAVFSVEDDNIRIGLGAIKNVGLELMSLIVSEREKNGAFKDFYDFLKRVEPYGCNKKTIESLIFSGALDCFKVFRSQMMAVYSGLMDKVIRDRQQSASGQINMFADLSEELDSVEFPNVAEFDSNDKLKYEKEYVGLYLSGNFLDDYKNSIQQIGCDTRKLAASERILDNGDKELTYENVIDREKIRLGGILIEANRIITKKGQEMGIGKLEDFYGIADVMLSGNMYPTLKDNFKVNNIVRISGSVSIRDDETPKVWIDSIEPLEKDSLGSQAEKKQDNSQMRVHLRYDYSNPMLQAEIFECLESYEGNAKVIAFDSASGKRYMLPYEVSASKELMVELSSIIGEKNVKIVK